MSAGSWSSMKRVPQQEWLDEDIGAPAEISASLEDLRTINRRFGGVGTTAYLLRNAMQEARVKSATVLDVAAGDGFCARRAARNLTGNGLEVSLTLLDRRVSHLPASNGIETVVGDALQLPFDDGAFDFVSCGLFLHHLDPDGVVCFVNEALRVARLAVLINDLRRTAAHLLLVYAGFPLFRSRLTKHDAPASVKQAYTPNEIIELLKGTSARRVEITNRYLYRMAVTVWR